MFRENINQWAKAKSIRKGRCAVFIKDKSYLNEENSIDTLLEKIYTMMGNFYIEWFYSMYYLKLIFVHTVNNNTDIK